MELKEVALSFDVRKECLEKEYVYKIEANMGDSMWNPLQQYKLVDSVANKLDVDRMKKAADILKGTHNFYNFTVRNRKMKHETFRYMRTINEIYFEEKINAINNIQKILIGFKARGFLTYQIRYMTSALKEIGEGIYSPEILYEAFQVDCEKEIEIARKPAPAKGLFLKNVIFKNDDQKIS